MESLYWVFTYRRNDRCEHCYNESGPDGRTLSLEDCLKVVENLPDRIGRLILSGGEPLAEPDKLLAICDAVRARYGPGQALMVQTNGDLLTPSILRELDQRGVSRIDVASMDRWHRRQGRQRSKLERMFSQAGWRSDEGRVVPSDRRVFAFWGGTPELWLGGNWPRGRALDSDAARLDPEHNFCGLWSGAVGFLDDDSPSQEVAIQLYEVFPCCPATWFSLGDARIKSVEDILARCRSISAFRALNEGDPASLSAPGMEPAYGRGRICELGCVCLWCDEFFREHYSGPRGERRHFR